MAEALHHGGRLAEARRRFPDAPEPWIDLSTGINPIPFPFTSPPLAAFTRLPEPEEELALRVAAAHAYGVVDPAMVVAAPGTQVLVNLLPRICPLATVAVLGPTYAEHAACWRAAGSEVVEVGRFADLEPQHDERTRPSLVIPAKAEAQLVRNPARPSSLDLRLRGGGGELHSRRGYTPGDGTGAVLCNPNNPDGRRVARGDLTALADRLAVKGGLLVVDEAFADLEGPEASVAPFLPRDGLLVLRSFGKTYGLAGLRLGFALASPGLAETLRAALGLWAVSGPAIAIARRAFADVEWLAAASARLQRDASGLDRILMRAGFRIVGGTRLYRLVETDRAPALYDALGRAGILVRRFGRSDHRLRFGIPGKDEHWRRLRAVLSV